MAAKVTSGTLRIIANPVGLNLNVSETDATSIQQLLKAAGEPIRVDGDWGEKSQTILISFQKKRLTSEPLVFPAGRVYDVLTVDSPALELLAYEAGVLLPVLGEKGMKALTQMHDWLVANKVRYQTGAESGGGNRAVWGLFNNRQLAIQTMGPLRSFLCAPILLDCTTYVNLMLALYFDGHLNGKYAADLAATGGGSAATEHIGKSRWGFQLVTNASGGNYHSTADEIVASTAARPGKLFHIEVGRTWNGVPGFVKHMALIYGDTVYECTTAPILNGSACLSRPISDFMDGKGNAIFYLFAEP